MPRYIGPESSTISNGYLDSNLIIPDGGKLGSESTPNTATILSSGDTHFYHNVSVMGYLSVGGAPEGVVDSNLTVDRINFNTSNNQTFTLKAVDAPLASEPSSGQFAVYNGATKLWGINESGWVQNPKNPMCVLFDYDNTPLTSGVTAYPFNGIAIDTNNNYDISDVGNPKFFAPIDGYYYVSVNSRFYYDFNGRADGNILINDVGRIAIYFDYFAGAASQDFQQVTGNTIVKMSAGDYLKIGVTVNSGTNHLGWSASSYTIGETDNIGNSCSHANIFLIG